MSMQIFDQ